MAEEFQGGVCGGNWPWNSSRNLFGSSPCSLATNDIGTFGWPTHDDLVMDMKAARSSEDSTASDGGGSVVIQDVQKPLPTMADSTFQMLGISLSSSTTPDWNQDLLHDSGRSVESYSNFLLDSSMNYQQETIEDSSINPLNSISASTDQCAVTCSGLSNGFPLNSASYTYASSLLQTLFDTDSQPQQPSFPDNQAMNYSSSAANSYQVNSNGFLPSLPKTSPMPNPSFPKPQPTNRLPLNTNNAPLWNSTAEAFSNVLPSTQSQLLPSSLTNKRPNLQSIGSKHQHEEGKNLTSVTKKGSNEPAYKRQRIETPSPLPTFKVRKEKLGDRITALQQLVSPFGKTDTASVLHEAIDYIKFLHDQVNALSTPYLKYGSSPLQHQQGSDKSKDQEGLTRGLKSRGLCLVPISSTFPVAAETPSDFWTPTFGVNLK